MSRSISELRTEPKRCMWLSSVCHFSFPCQKFSSFLWGPGWINQMLFVLGFSLSPGFCVILSSRASLRFSLPPICATYSTLPKYLRYSTSHWIFITPPPPSSPHLPPPRPLHLAPHDTTLFFLASAKLSTK